MRISTATVSKVIITTMLALIASAVSARGTLVSSPQLVYIAEHQLEKIEIPGNKCTGFYETPSWKCQPITIPVYLRRAADHRALVVISHGSQGLDTRHFEYARQLADNGINAVVIGHWEARGLSRVQVDYDKGLRAGGDAPNMVLDVLTVLEYFKSLPEWKDAKVGQMGESMGGSTALHLTRPWLRRAYADLYGHQPIKPDALVALYAGCTDHFKEEGFLPFPLLFISGSDDGVTLAINCQKQVPYMNAKGGNAQITILPGELHDFDAPYSVAHHDVQNQAQCANMRENNMFTLEITGAKYPNTPEGLAAMRKDCIALSNGATSGNKGNPTIGFNIWTEYLQSKLLN